MQRIRKEPETPSSPGSNLVSPRIRRESERYRNEILVADTASLRSLPNQVLANAFIFSLKKFSFFSSIEDQNLSSSSI